jgi:hypothetical protein
MVAFNHYQLLAPLSRACIPSEHSPSQFSVPVHSPYYSSISSLFRSPAEQGFRKTSFFLLPSSYRAKERENPSLPIFYWVLPGFLRVARKSVPPLLGFFLLLFSLFCFLVFSALSF